VLAPALAVRSGAERRGMACRTAPQLPGFRALLLVSDGRSAAQPLDVGGLPVRDLHGDRRAWSFHGSLAKPLVRALRRPGAGRLRSDAVAGPAIGRSADVGPGGPVACARRRGDPGAAPAQPTGG